MYFYVKKEKYIQTLSLGKKCVHLIAFPLKYSKDAIFHVTFS